MFCEKREMFLLKLLIPQKLLFSTGTNILTDSDHSSGWQFMLQLYMFAFGMSLVYNVVVLFLTE